MNSNRQAIKVPTNKPKMPLYASPWMALYMVLRNEWTQSRSGNE